MKMGKNQWIGKNILIPEKVLEHLDQEMEEAAEGLEQMEKIIQVLFRKTALLNLILLNN